MGKVVNKPHTSAHTLLVPLHYARLVVFLQLAPVDTAETWEDRLTPLGDKGHVFRSSTVDPS